MLVKSAFLCFNSSLDVLAWDSALWRALYMQILNWNFEMKGIRCYRVYEPIATQEIQKAHHLAIAREQKFR